MTELNYYTCSDGFNYVDTFNEEWIENHEKDLSGPLYCNNCHCYGTISQNGVNIFLGYCLNCAINLYDKVRGNGFSGFDNVQISSIYEYPEYLVNYKNTILELVKKNEDFVNYMNYQDFPHHPLPPSPILVSYGCESGDCDCENDIDINLSPKNSEVYSDSDYDY